MNFFCDGIPFKVSFQEFDTSQHKLIYADRSVEVYSIPLKHRVPCSGFLFKEKPGDRHLIRDMIDFYQIPISQRNLIKKGADFISEEGKTIPNHLLTTDPDKTISYAYCSDTAYCEEIVPIISKVDLLYHEATFANAEVLRAQKTMHSTAEQAANIARLAEVKQLVIGHLSARYKNQDAVLKEAQAVFKDTTLARDGQVIEF
jgi:ribonuclease Z